MRSRSLETFRNHTIRKRHPANVEEDSLQWHPSKEHSRRCWCRAVERRINGLWSIHIIWMAKRIGGWFCSPLPFYMTTSCIIVIVVIVLGHLNTRFQTGLGGIGNTRDQAHTCSHGEGANFRSTLRDRRRHVRRRFIILEIVGQRSHTDLMQSQFLLDMSDTATPRQAALGNCKENMENTQDLRTLDLDTHSCWGNAHRAGPIGRIRKGSQTAPLHRYLILGRCIVNAKFEFHPSIKQRRVQKTLFFPDQGGSLHCLKHISKRAASAAQPSWT